MTLEEAIKHCEEVAEENEKNAKNINNIYKKSCLECASEHRQVAEWLKELKEYKDERVGCEYCKHKFREQHERPCSLCQRNFMDMFEREVNADEDSNIR
jgi:DNA-directed RNA polymerase subunit RPC12/RpoP